MRKIVFLMHVSLDGMVEGPNGAMDMDWITYNEDVQALSREFHNTMDAVIYGRSTFQMMEAYFPALLASNPDNEDGDVIHARWLDQATKYVFSRTMENSDWNNTVVIGDNIAEEVRKIKEQPGKDIWMLGSPSLAQEFMRLGLIDEYRLNINPVALGSGKNLFTGLDKYLKLKLIEARPLKGGVIATRYVPE